MTIESSPSLRALACFLLLCGPVRVDAQGNRSAALNRGADSCRAHLVSFKRVLARTDSVFQGVGSQAAILYRGRIAVLVENGFSDLEHRVPVTAETRFQVASVTKAFTGLALLTLRDDGRVDLDGPVQAYVPEFPQKRGRITPRQLAAHLSGIRHYREERTPNFLFTHYDSVRPALALFAGDSLAAEPGTRFIYSSYGYNLLAAVIGGASGMEFTDYLRTAIIEPLGLRRTMSDNVLLPVEGRARGYTYYFPWYSRAADTVLRRVPDFDYSYNMGGGNLLSTARDLVYVGRAAIRAGLLKPASIALLSAPIDAERSRWTFGWSVDSSDTQSRLRAEGSVPGFQATIEAYPADDLVIAYLQNSWGRFPADPRMAPAPLAELRALCLEGETD